MELRVVAKYPVLSIPMIGEEGNCERIAFQSLLLYSALRPEWRKVASQWGVERFLVHN